MAGTVKIEHTLARLGAERLWSLLHSEDYVHALGALTGGRVRAWACVGVAQPCCRSGSGGGRVGSGSWHAKALRARGGA